MNVQVKRWLLSYAVAAVIFAAVDVVWIGTVANNQYESQIGDLLAPSVNLVGAVASTSSTWSASCTTASGPITRTPPCASA